LKSSNASRSQPSAGKLVSVAELRVANVKQHAHSIVRSGGTGWSLSAF
jgi:hypothetical protein